MRFNDEIMIDGLKNLHSLHEDFARDLQDLAQKYLERQQQLAAYLGVSVPDDAVREFENMNGKIIGYVNCVSSLVRPVVYDAIGAKALEMKICGVANPIVTKEMINFYREMKEAR